MRERLKKVGIGFTVLIIVGLAYFLICNKIGFGIPCLFHTITGLKCPGCGVSRMCISLLKGDIHSAFLYNRGIMVMSPFIVYFCVKELYLYVRYNDFALKKQERVLAIILIALLLIFDVLRNFLGW